MISMVATKIMLMKKIMITMIVMEILNQQNTHDCSVLYIYEAHYN